MRKPNKTGLQRHVAMMGIGSVIGLAGMIELQVLLPGNPVEAILTVMCASLIATACKVGDQWT